RARLVAPVCALAGGGAMVPGGPARRSGSDVDRAPDHTRGPCGVSRSRFELPPPLPQYIRPPPPVGRSTGRSGPVAGFRAAPPAAGTRPAGRDPHRRGAVGLLAPADILRAGVA